MDRMDDNASLRRSYNFECDTERIDQEILEAVKLLKEKGNSTGIFKDINQFIHSSASKKQEKDLVTRIRGILNEIAPGYSNRSPALKECLLYEFYKNLDIKKLEGEELNILVQAHVLMVALNLLQSI